MKIQIKRELLFVMILIFGTLLISGCSNEENLINGGRPKISYIRMTDPKSSDSLIVSASQNQMIAIMGENLQKTAEVWVNDRKASVISTFITSTTVIARVPELLPTNITNTLTLKFTNGDSLVYPFTLKVGKPIIDYMLSEYVTDGDIATIRGNYFYKPAKVFFPGNVEGEIVEISQDMIKVKVPQGARPGPISVETNFGTAKSKLYFRDNRNMISTFDGPTDGWAKGTEFIKESDPDIANINGNFMRINQVIGGWQWWEMYIASRDSDVKNETKNIPQAAFLSPSSYTLKFEISTLTPLTGAWLKMFMGPDIYNRGEAAYIWQPNLDTKGKWETVSIPFSNFYSANLLFPYNPDGYGVFFFFHGPNEADVNIAIDNLRVVPNK